MKLLTLLFILFCFQFGFTQNSSNDNLKRNLFDDILASGDFGLMGVSPKSGTYNLYKNYNSTNFQLINTSYNNSNSPSGLVVFDIRRSDNNSGLLFRVIDKNGNVGWINESMLNFSDLELAFAIGLINDKENYYVNSYLVEEFKSLYDINEKKLLTLNNSLVNEKNKNKYSQIIETKRIGDSIHIFKEQKLFFGYNCEAPINEVIVDKNDKVFLNGVESNITLKEKNIFRILIDNGEKITIQANGKVELIDINQLSNKIIIFLENGSGIGDEKCDYCEGRKHHASSSNPLKATLLIQNKLDIKNYYKTYDIYREIRKSYETLWKNIAGKNGVTEFDKIQCEIRNSYQKKYPVNIMYYHRDNKYFYLETPPPPPPAAPEVIEVVEETVIVPVEPNQEVDRVVENVEVPFAVVEHVPVFPGCENGNNDDKKTCMNNTITAFLNKKFNKDIKTELGLSGNQNIFILFKIDKTGNVVNTKTRAPHPSLEEEAKRIINLLPKMIPGSQYGKNVIVTYYIKLKI
ncbi:energy transducer TonB [Xanthomarina sp. F2636L]|uniref:energy transducer TonB n=1 Tax=Xanthomarina sp. F2636L TaxID=2996018 RepID=UPI00225E6CE8|nr:hypothetical protein [Xanthomarina sp. F2636L]MCX7552131.1 hypothetical protein [Xanthomarina sp. F2636L]